MSIRLSERYGVNPSLSLCFFCMEENGEIVLPGRLPGDVEAPRKAVWNKIPCAKCKEYMSQGIILISVDEKLSEPSNPYRTGAWIVLREDALRRMLSPGKLLDDICKVRVAFIPDDAWDKLGLPRGAVQQPTDEKG